MNQTEVKEMAAEKNALQRASDILNARYLKYIESIDVNLPGMCYGIDVAYDWIFASCIVKKNGGMSGEIYRRPLYGNGRFEKIISEIPLLYPSIPLRCVIGRNAILYTKKDEQKGTCIVEKNLQTGDENIYESIPGAVLRNITALKLIDGCIAATDPITNTAAFFSGEGNFMKTVLFPPQVQYPACIEKLDGGGFIAGFLNKHCNYNGIELKANDSMPGIYLAATDDHGRIQRDMTSAAEYVFEREPIASIARIEEGSIFVLTARHLIKLDGGLYSLLIIDLPTWIPRASAFETEPPGNSHFLGMAYSGARLYIMESMVCKRIIVLGTGKSANGW